MLAIPVYNMKGEQTGEVEVDPSLLGGRVRHRLIKQAIVAFQDHQRQQSARTKGRAQVQGSTRKLYRQKGTGNARAGAIRTPVRRGGGRTFAKRAPRHVAIFPRKMRRLARDSAVLAKMQASEVFVIEDLAFSEPKTKPFFGMMTALGVERGCLIALPGYDEAVYRSGRNIPNTDIRMVDDLNAYEVLRRPKLVLTKPALERLLEPRRRTGPAATE